MYIYARHLYKQEVLRFKGDFKPSLNRKVTYRYEPYVIFHYGEERINDYEKSGHITVTYDNLNITYTVDTIYLYAVTFNSGGKQYHYWSNNKYNIGDSVFIGEEQKEVTIVKIVPYDEYANSLVNKFFPKENVDIWEYVVKNCNTKESLVVYNYKEMSSSWLYDKQSNSIYYVLNRKLIKTKFNNTFLARDLIEVKPFICRFINKDNTFSKKTYIYFTDNIGFYFRKYYTQHNQLLHYEKSFCLYSHDNLIHFAEENNYELKFKYKELREVAQESTDDRLDALTYSFNRVASAAKSSTHALKLDRDEKTISSLIYGEPILNKNEKENTTMNFMKNLEFGKVNTKDIKMSMCGLAFRRADNSYATYNAKENSFTDVTDFLMDLDCVYIIPVAAKDIKVGDIVKHLNTFVVVKNINEDGSISAISPIKAEEICIIPTKNLFGFNYYSKVMNFLDGAFTPNEGNPFGNPLMLMMLFGNEKGENRDFKDILPLLLLNNQSEEGKDLLSNPLLFLALK